MIAIGQKRTFDKTAMLERTSSCIQTYWMWMGTASSAMIG